MNTSIDKDSVALQLFERTLYHYLVFSDDSLINAALASVNITVDKEKKEYQDQIKQNNETHVVAAFQQTNNDQRVISDPNFNEFIIEIDDPNVNSKLKELWEKSQSVRGGKTKKRRKLIGGAIDKNTMYTIHAEIAKLAFDTTPGYIFFNFNINRAKENFHKASEKYNESTKTSAESLDSLFAPPPRGMAFNQTRIHHLQLSLVIRMK